MKSSFEFLLNLTFRVMNKVMNNLKNLCNSIVIQQVNENVTRFPDQNTLNTKVKQIRNPQKEISGGFFILFYQIFFLKINWVS
jgi:hypothetical protein